MPVISFKKKGNASVDSLIVPLLFHITTRYSLLSEVLRVLLILNNRQLRLSTPQTGGTITMHILK